MTPRHRAPVPGEHEHFAKLEVPHERRSSRGVWLAMFVAGALAWAGLVLLAGLVF